MSDCPQELHYTSTHEWVRLENDDTVIVGVTDYAQQQLGDLVFVELPKPGFDADKGGEIVVLESVKTAADVYAPLTGEVIEVNTQLDSEPELINQDPYGSGWIYKLRLEDAKELDELLSAQRYAEMIEGE